jgi:hypothetical protein
VGPRRDHEAHGSLAEDRVEPETNDGKALPRHPVVAPAEPTATPPSPEVPSPALPSLDVEPPPSSEPPPKPARRHRASTGAPEPPRHDTLAAETAIVRRARAELSRGRAQQALTILAEHAEQFPRGALTEEAQAVRTMAQCRLRSSDAPRLGAAFAERFPASLFRHQVEAACK